MQNQARLLKVNSIEKRYRHATFLQKKTYWPFPRITLFPLMSFSTFALFHLSMYMLGKTAFIESLLRDFIQGSKMHAMQGVGVV